MSLDEHMLSNKGSLEMGDCMHAAPLTAHHLTAHRCLTTSKTTLKLINDVSHAETKSNTLPMMFFQGIYTTTCNMDAGSAMMLQALQYSSNISACTILC